MKLSLNLNSITSRFKRNKLLIFWVAIIVLLLAEIWVLKGSIGILFDTKPQVPVSGTSAQVVHINFDQYNSVIKKLDDANSYQPIEVPVSNPFSLGNGQ